MLFISKNIILIYILGLILQYTNSTDFKGRFANIGELPYVVHILIEKPQKTMCTGALIDPNWILSAAHCFNTDTRSGKPSAINPEFVTGIRHRLGLVCNLYKSFRDYVQSFRERYDRYEQKGMEFIKSEVPNYEVDTKRKRKRKGMPDESKDNDSDTSRFDGRQDMIITAGINDFANTSIPSSQKRVGYEIILHPDYEPQKLSKLDFALVKVKKPFELNANVSTIEIEGTGWPWLDGKKGRNCIAGGFGRVSMSSYGSNTRLKYMEVKALHGDRSCPCTKRWQWKRLVCLKPEEGIGLCPGDSGSVVACDNKAIGVAHVILDKRSCSFVHMPDRNLECLKLTTITFLMFICPENNWIKKYVPNVTATPESCKSSMIQLNLVTILATICILIKLN